jgi:hypothetical protein
LHYWLPGKFKPNLDNFKKLVKEALDEWYRDNKEKFDYKIDKKEAKDILTEWYNEESEHIGKDLTKHKLICESIVGESYIKYDANTTFWPTLIFRFKPASPLDPRKYAQLKRRFFKKPKKISLEDTNELVQKLFSLKDFTYKYGGLKCHYVAPNKLFKTTLFSYSKEEGLRALVAFLPLSGTNFVPENLYPKMYPLPKLQVGAILHGDWRNLMTFLLIK